MNKYIVDTCVMLFWATTPERLSNKATKIIEDPISEIFVSTISAAEIACLVEKKRIKPEKHWKLWFRSLLEISRWGLLDITLDTIEEAYSLPGNFHSDPVDRLLVATTRTNPQYTLITADQKILDYPHCRSVW